MDVGGGEHRLVAFDAGLIFDAAEDSPLASVQLAMDIGIHSKASGWRTVEGGDAPRLFAETRRFRVNQAQKTWGDAWFRTSAARPGGLTGPWPSPRTGLDRRPLDPDRPMQVPGHPRIRTSDLRAGPAAGSRDMEPIALVPMISSTKQAVAECLELPRPAPACPRDPRRSRTDLHGGVEIFRQHHPRP